MRKLLVVVICALALGACGRKGPLYLPKDGQTPPPAKPAAGKPAADKPEPPKSSGE